MDYSLTKKCLNETRSMKKCVRVKMALNLTFTRTNLQIRHKRMAMERYAVVEAPAAMKGKVTYIDNFIVISSDNSESSTVM